MKKKFWLVILAAACVIGLDQWTKQWAYMQLQTRDIVVLRNWFSLTYVTNTGAAFGLLAGMNLPFLLFGLGTLVYLGYWFLTGDRLMGHGYLRICYGVTMGGVIGNLIDRVVRGAVVDWIEISFFSIFNLADMAMSVGVLFMIIYIFFRR